MLHIAMVEDEERYINQMQDFIRRYGEESGEEIQFTIFRDGTEILRQYRPIFDIIFLDIEMPGLDGMSTAEQIRKFDSDVVLVFVTNMAQYAIRGYSGGAGFCAQAAELYHFYAQAEAGRLQSQAAGERAGAPLPP